MEPEVAARPLPVSPARRASSSEREVPPPMSLASQLAAPSGGGGPRRTSAPVSSHCKDGQGRLCSRSQP